jgi:hypothetical protein
MLMFLAALAAQIASQGVALRGARGPEACTAWYQGLVRAMADDDPIRGGIAGRTRPTSSKAPAHARVEVVRADRPLHYSTRWADHDARGYNRSASTDKPFHGESDAEYEHIARDLTPRETIRLSAMATDRRNWLGEKYPPQVGDSGFYVIPMAVPGSDPVQWVAVACAAEYRKRFGQAFAAEWIIVCATHDECLDVAFKWAAQWSDRLAADDERIGGMRPEWDDPATLDALDRRPRRTHDRTGYAPQSECYLNSRSAYDRWLARPPVWPDTATIVVTDLDGNQVGTYTDTLYVDRLALAEDEWSTS